MTLISFCFWFLGSELLLCGAVLGLSALTQDFLNHDLEAGQFTPAQHHVSKISALLQYFVLMHYLAPLVSLVQTVILVFRFSMQMPYVRTFLLLSWGLSLGLSGMFRVVLKSFVDSESYPPEAHPEKN